MTDKIELTPERYASLIETAYQESQAHGWDLPRVTKENFKETLRIASLPSGAAIIPRYEGDGWLLLVDLEHSWDPHEKWAEIEKLLPDA